MGRADRSMRCVALALVATLHVAAAQDVFLSARQLSGAEDAPKDSEVESTAPNITASLSAQSVSSFHPCCSRCPHHGFCSPQTYSCYHSKDKEYYASCGSVQPSCCSSCPHHGF